MKKLNKNIEYSIQDYIIEIYASPQATIQDATEFMANLERFYNTNNYNIVWVS